MKNKKLWIIVGVVVVVLAIIGAVTQSNNPTSANDVTPTTQAAQAPTSQPTPTATLTTEQYAIQLAQQNAPSASKQSAKLDSSGGLTITEYRDIVSQTMVKVDCYNILKAIWQAKLPGINDVDLQIYAQNDAGIVGVVGDCSVSHSLNWESLDYRSAWYQYDTAFVFPTLPQ